MSEQIEYIVANPSGNITIMVISQVERENYQEIAAKFLDSRLHNAEQVAFIKKHETSKDSRADGYIEMCGLEFCGNAARSFGLYLAGKKGINGECILNISISGSSEVLPVAVNTITGYTKILMPNPIYIEHMVYDMTEICLVNFGGIIHAVVFDKEPSREMFDSLKGWIAGKYDPPAIGVMFYDKQREYLTPIVYVKDVDTTYFEGSCGSGTTATAIALCVEGKEGAYTYKMFQPAGTILSTVIKKEGAIDKVYIEGKVELSGIQILEV